MFAGVGSLTVEQNQEVEGASFAYHLCGRITEI